MYGRHRSKQVGENPRLAEKKYYGKILKMWPIIVIYLDSCWETLMKFCMEKISLVDPSKKKRKDKFDRNQSI